MRQTYKSAHQLRDGNYLVYKRNQGNAKMVYIMTVERDNFFVTHEYSVSNALIETRFNPINKEEKGIPSVIRLYRESAYKARTITRGALNSTLDTNIFELTDEEYMMEIAIDI